MTQSDRYHYTECGLDNVYLLNGFEPVETPRGVGIRIRDREGLHLAISRLLVREKKDLNGKEFRFLRHELDMTQQVIANVLRVDTQTVARWEKGRTGAIPGPAQGMIRVLYEAKTGGNIEITRLLEELAELDEIIHGDDDGTEAIDFEDTGEGWQQSELVAA
jgi:putative transcriptional regulator